MKSRSLSLCVCAALLSPLFLGGCANLSWQVVHERPMPELDQELVAAMDRQMLAAMLNGEPMLGSADGVGGMMHTHREYVVLTRYLRDEYSDDVDALLAGVTVANPE